MPHPHTELRFINAQIGYGVLATHVIPRGTITWVRDDLDQTFSLAQVERMPSLYRDIIAKYSFVDSQGEFVLCWDLARYLNHSCQPSCRSAGYDFELAVRDIQPGEELTDDYGSLNLEYDFRCACATAGCRETIRPDDLLTYAAEWDQSVTEPFRLMPTVAQPLWPFIKDKGLLAAVLACHMPIASCRENYSPLHVLQPAQGARAPLMPAPRHPGRARPGWRPGALESGPDTVEEHAELEECLRAHWCTGLARLRLSTTPGVDGRRQEGDPPLTDEGNAHGEAPTRCILLPSSRRRSDTSVERGTRQNASPSSGGPQPALSSEPSAHGVRHPRTSKRITCTTAGDPTQMVAGTRAPCPSPERRR